MVKDVEMAHEHTLDRSLSGYDRAATNYKAPTPSLAECWKWMKGLLYDFVNLKESSSKLEFKLEKANKVINSQKSKIDRLHNYQEYFDNSHKNQ
jgi:hypothetical protein